MRVPSMPIEETSIERIPIAEYDHKWYQFSLKTLLWVVVYFCVLAKVCTGLYMLGMEGSSVSRLVFLFSWTGVILAHLAFSVWGWLRLRKIRADESAQFREYRHRFWVAFSWGIWPLALWLSALTISGNSDFVWGQLAIAAHLIPLALVCHLPYVLGFRGRGDGPVWAMRLAGLIGIVFPLFVFLL